MTLKMTKIMMSTLVAVAVLAAPLPSRAQEQRADGARLSFEAASINPSSPDARGVRVQSPPGRFLAQNVTMKQLIQQAYGVMPFYISGGPGWVSSDRFDVNAKAEGNISSEQRRAMLQSLLAERCKLVVHFETRDLPIYALVVAKGGPKLHESPAGTEDQGTELNGAPGGMSAQRATMSTLAGFLSRQFGRKVADKTGLKGSYDFKLEYTPDQGMRQVRGSGGQDPDSPLPAEPEGPSLFTALQEQLGLKLEPARGPVEVLVIDRVEKPSGN